LGECDLRGGQAVGGGVVHVCGEKGLAVDFVLGHRDEAEVNLRMKCGFEIEVDPTERSVSMDFHVSFIACLPRYSILLKSLFSRCRPDRH